MTTATSVADADSSFLTKKFIEQCSTEGHVDRYVSGH